MVNKTIHTPNHNLGVKYIHTLDQNLDMKNKRVKAQLVHVF